jgi:hypothetical protein
LTIDLGGALRRRKPEKRRAQIKLRAGDELTGIDDLDPVGPAALLADTNVYINDAAANLPAAVEVLLDRANRNDFDLIQQIAPEGRFVHY